MHDAPQSLILAGVVVALLSWRQRHSARRSKPTADDRDRALCAAAMVQAACFGNSRHLPRAVRTAAVRSILCFDAVSVESILGGRRALSSGLRRYLRLVDMSFVGHHETEILDRVADYLRTARRLRGPRCAGQRAALFDALHEVATWDGEVQATRLAELARSLARRPISSRRAWRNDDAALLWLYGVRVAWLWCGSGGGRSPFLMVSRASLMAARMLRR